MKHSRYLETALIVRLFFITFTGVNSLRTVLLKGPSCLPSFQPFFLDQNIIRNLNPKVSQYVDITELGLLLLQITFNH